MENKINKFTRTTKKKRPIVLNNLIKLQNNFNYIHVINAIIYFFGILNLFYLC